MAFSFVPRTALAAAICGALVSFAPAAASGASFDASLFFNESDLFATQ